MFGFEVGGCTQEDFTFMTVSNVIFYFILSGVVFFFFCGVHLYVSGGGGGVRKPMGVG